MLTSLKYLLNIVKRFTKANYYLFKKPQFFQKFLKIN